MTALGLSRPLPPDGLVVVSALASEARYVPGDVPVVVTGIGTVAAATRTALALAPLVASGARPWVVNLGTAGALQPGRSGVFRPSRVVLWDASAEAIRAVGEEFDDEWNVTGPVEGDGCVLATGDVFVTDAGVRDSIAQRAQLVDMEGFAVVQVCRELGVPVTLLKAVSDEADTSALDWPTVIDHCAQQLAAELTRLRGTNTAD
ncbi:MAG: nucleosidase [Actinomycetes bacterium]